MSDEANKNQLIWAEGITKAFQVGEKTVEALRGVDLEVKEKDFIVIFGPSGCGKSTFLNVLVGLEKPTSGLCLVKNKNIYSLESDDIGKLRADIFGIIYQKSYWVSSLSVLENVSLPLIINGFKEKEAHERAKEFLETLKIGNLTYHKPTHLSSGEQQKVACARALVTDPEIIIADEPTGNLDTSSADNLIAIIESLNRGWAKTVILVTHNPAYRQIGTRQIEMRDGKIVKEKEQSWL